MFKQRKIIVNDIPCFEIIPENEDIKADLLLYHGWGSHATKQCFRAKLLAGFGYRVLVPEIALHGERGICDYDAPDSAVMFLEVLLQSIHEANCLIDQGLASDRSRFVVGHSLGGMIALGAAAENAMHVDGFVAMNSTAQWHAYEAIMAGVFPNQSLDIVKSEPFEALTERLTPYNPECWKKQGMTQPVLLTNGALDQTLPANYNVQFCRESMLENVSQIIFFDAGHVVTDGMLFEVLAFIENLGNKRI